MAGNTSQTFDSDGHKTPYDRLSNTSLLKYPKYSRRKRSRTLPAEYPTAPLDNNIPRKFVINRAKRPSCGLPGHIVNYNVLMIEEEFDDIFTNFYAIVGEDITRIRDEDFSEHDWYWSRYNNQIGWAACQPGWIGDVWVNSGSDPKTEFKTNARGCGIASVLTQLCLLDPKLNGRNKERGNSAIGMLNKVADLKGYVKKIKEDCKQFVGLDNVPDPKSGAFAYFSAAIREDYGEMLVQQKEKRPGLRPKLQSFSIYDPEDAKKHYDPKTGNIGQCGCNDYVCKAHGAHLFFCKF